jgi:hypothetical protein
MTVKEGKRLAVRGNLFSCSCGEIMGVRRRRSYEAVMTRRISKSRFQLNRGFSFDKSQEAWQSASWGFWRLIEEHLAQESGGMFQKQEPFIMRQVSEDETEV